MVRTMRKPTTPLSSEDWDTLLSAIQEGRCTPFLGAGVNVNLLPNGGRVAEDWARIFKYPLQDKSDLSRVAQYLAIHKRDDMWPKDEILRLFRKSTPTETSLKSHLKPPEHPLGVLAELPLPVYMTTNYDDFMLQALRFAGKTPRLELCRWNEAVKTKHKSIFDNRAAFLPTADGPVVFHLHGHQNMRESLVLTEDDYHGFLITFAKERKLLPPRIQEACTYSSLLFIGYRLADIDFRVLFRSIFQGMEPGLRRVNLAIQLPPEDGPNARAYLDKYFGKFNVTIVWAEAAEFMKDLWRRWRSLNK
jgi:hypothetical protein